MSLIKLAIPPGVYRNSTDYTAGLRWHDVNLVRWIDGTLAPVGGWQLFSITPVTGSCRGLFAWRDNEADAWLAVGTNEKLYVLGDGNIADITPAGFTEGYGTSLPGLGYGAVDYGEQTYGTARTGESSLVLDAATWSFDSWGENLVACATNDGKLYEWSLNTSTPAQVISNAPVFNRACLVSEQRHLIALGASGDPRLIKWSDAEDNTDWVPSSVNQAGDWLLNTQGLIRCGIKTRGEILILTSADAHSMRFIGSPLVFSFDRVGSNCGIAGPNAVVALDGGAGWFGTDGTIYAYDGAVRPVPCDVQDWIRENYDKLKSAQVYGGSLSEQNEVWWYFPALDGTIKYVIYNYQTNTWSIGSLDRTAWLDRGVWRYPVAVSSDGYLYQHEDGDTDSGDTRVGTIYAETGFGEIGEGDNVLDIVQIIPDERTRGDVKVTLRTKYVPNGTESTFGPYVVRDDGYTDTRASGRQAKIKFEPVTDTDWRVGTYRADVKISGQR